MNKRAIRDWIHNKYQYEAGRNLLGTEDDCNWQDQDSAHPASQVPGKA